MKVGDRVRLANGKKELEVVHIVRNYVTAAYLKNGKLPGWDYERSTKTLPQQSFVLFNEKENEMTNKLFQTKEEKPRYGTFLAKNSKGETVLDMKGTGVPEAFGKNEIEEVIPYTFKVEGRGRDSEYTSHYTCEKGVVEIGSILVSMTGNLYIVTELDTKAANPKGEFKGTIVTGEAIGR